MKLSNAGQPLVSVIMPTYNHAKFIGKAIDSVLSQTYKNFELIIIDNYSEDDTEKIVASYEDDRITYLKFRNNGIIAASRNHGIKHSHGDYIAFLDSDDIWYPEKLSLVKSIFKRYSDVDIVHHSEMEVCSDGRKRILNYGQVKQPAYTDLLFVSNKVSTSATVVRRELAVEVGGFSEDMDFNSAEDYDFWLKLAKAGGKFYYLNRVLGEYYRGPEAVTSKIEYHAQNAFNVYKSHIKQLREEGELTDFRFNKLLEKRKLEKLFSVGRQYHRVCNYLDSHKFFIRAIKKRPLWYKPYMGLLLTFMKIKR